MGASAATDPIGTISGMGDHQLRRVLIVVLGNSEPEVHRLIWSVLDYVIATTPEDEVTEGG